MQAADLLAIIVPGAAQAGPPGPSAGKGAAGLGKAGGEPDAGQAADAANPFAQALAALMAAPGLAQPQVQSPPAQTEDGTATQTAPADTPALNKGLQTALAATAAAGAQAKGLAKILAGQASATEPAAEPAGDPADGQIAESAAEQPVPAAAVTAEDAAAPGDGEPSTTGGGPILPEQAKADEALARRQARPSPRADRADEVAKGPQLPAWARTPPTAPAATNTETAPSPPTETPVADEAAAPPPNQTAVDGEAPTDPITALAAAETAPKPAAPATGKTDGKALKAVDKVKGDDESEIHTPRGIGKGLATAPGQLKKAGDETTDSEAPPADLETASAPADQSAGPDASNTTLAAADTGKQAALTQAHADRPVAGAHTVAHLAEQIVSRAEGKSTRFDVQLDPAGLGKVDVKIEIDRSGQIQAALTFDNPQAAAELRSRAGELRTALEQAGFDLSKGGLSFDFSGQHQGQNLFDQHNTPSVPQWARASFTDLSTLAEPPGAARRSTIDAGGVDVTV